MCIKLLLRSLFVFFIISGSVLQAQENNEVLIANEYFQKKEYSKAQDVYADLAKKRSFIPLIHSNYIATLYALEDFKSLKKYLTTVIKKYPTTVSYQIDLGIMEAKQGNDKQADKIFSGIITDNSQQPFMLIKAGEYFKTVKLYSFGAEAYLAARTVLKQPNAYAIELANLYAAMEKRDAMLTEYFRFAEQSDRNLNYVKNILQSMFIQAEDQSLLEDVLIEKVQKNTSKNMYAELLIWLKLQQRDFRGAFIQARALERRTNGNKRSLFNIGEIAFKNKSYTDAIEIYEYLVDNVNHSSQRYSANRLLLRAREEKIKNSLPVNLDDVRELVKQYELFASSAGAHQEIFAAMRQKALLQAFYLDQRVAAIETLEKIKNSPSAKQNLKSTALVDLADIYLLNNEPWESTLLYSQVEKLEKETDLGNLAKLKNAKLNYYQGNFDLAQSRLDILKAATSREISNDAIELSGIIRNNSILDTSTTALKRFAEIDLLKFQNKNEEALAAYQQLISDFEGHSLSDEIWWRMAMIYMSYGNLTEAERYFKKIQDQFPADIYGDDSYFELAKIKEVTNQREEAKDMYKNLILKYPGSSYMEAARERYRELRGDTITQ